jgi:hypothetical protein
VVAGTKKELAMRLPRLPRRASCLAFVGSLAGAVVPSLARAQDELFSIEGDVANTRLGFRWGVAPLGDVDGDGHPDQFVASFLFDGAAGVECRKVYAFQGNDLYLNVTPDVVQANDTVTFTTTAGAPGNLVIDVVTELDGTPMFLLITPVLVFDANGELSLSGVVAPGLGVHDLKLQSYAIGRSGKLIESSVRALALR